MSIPFQDLTRLHGSIRAELDEAVASVVDRSAFVGGGLVATFEEAFAASHSVVGAAGCGSGTDALALALRVLDIGPGDEVVVPSMTFVATAEAVVHVGATPVLADVDPTTLLLTPEGVDAVRSERTRAVIPVHLYGHAVPFAHLQAWRDEGLVVVEDAAQAHLATDHGRSVGTIGHAACFSFYPGKNLGAWGDGGMVISDDLQVVERVRVLRDHGRQSKYAHEVIGWCSRLDNLQAAVLGVKLRHLTTWTAARRLLAERYLDHLGDRLVPWADGAVHHLLVLRLDDPAQRGVLQAALTAASIASGVHYPLPLSEQGSCQPWRRACPAAEAAGRTVLSLPMDPLMTLDEVDEVCRVVLATLSTATGP